MEGLQVALAATLLPRPVSFSAASAVQWGLGAILAFAVVSRPSTRRRSFADFTLVWALHSGICGCWKFSSPVDTIAQLSIVPAFVITSWSPGVRAMVTIATLASGSSFVFGVVGAASFVVPALAASVSKAEGLLVASLGGCFLEAVTSTLIITPPPVLWPATVATAILSGALLATGLSIEFPRISRRRLSPAKAVLSAVAISGAVHLVLLRRALGSDPVLWIFQFTLSSPTHCVAVAAWTAILLLALPALLPFGRHGARAGRVRQIELRKAFHLLAVGMFLPPSLHCPHFLAVAYAVAAAAMCIAESVRNAGLGSASAVLDRFLRAFTDDRDAGPVILTHIYLLVGCALPLWAHVAGAHSDPALPLAGVVALGVGDAVAAVVGSRYGATRWPRSRKTVEGTIAAAFSMALAFRMAVPHQRWLPYFLVSVATALLEASTDMIDNLVLPIAAGLWIMSLS